MKITFQLFFLLFFFSGCFTTMPHDNNSIEFRNRYMTYLEPGEKIMSYGFHYIISSTKEGKGIIRYFFPETRQLTKLITFKSNKDAIRDGLYKRWYDNGNRKEEGEYKNDQKEGHWRNYSYKDDSLVEEGDYINDKKNGVWKSYRDTVQLSKEQTYVDGVLEGMFTEYDTLGNIANSGIYKADTIFEQSNPPLIDLKKGDPEERMPCIKSCTHVTDREKRNKCSSEAMLQNIYKNIKYPKDAREYGVQGEAIVRFYIDKDGSVKDVTVLHGICQSISNECKRVVIGMPEWAPGMQYGKPVKVWFNLPINFRLE